MLAILPAMPLATSILSRVVASDTLEKLRAISLRIAQATCRYYFMILYGLWLHEEAVDVDYELPEGFLWMHRQYWENRDWAYSFSDYIKSHVV